MLVYCANVLILEAIVFRYDESATKRWWQPRHFGVVAVDSIGVLTSLWWLLYSPHWTTDVYLFTLVALYAVSGAYHHVRYRDWLGRLDHMMIFYIIAITALPYWGHILPWDRYWGGPLLILFICIVGTVIKLVSFLPRFLSAGAYLAAAVPMVSYFILSYDLIPAAQYTWWLVGIALYALQLGVYTLQQPDPYTELFGYREIQHLVLLCATNIHCYVAISLA